MFLQASLTSTNQIIHAYQEFESDLIIIRTEY
jgi:hypothetical protein